MYAECDTLVVQNRHDYAECTTLMVQNKRL